MTETSSPPPSGARSTGFSRKIAHIPAEAGTTSATDPPRPPRFFAWQTLVACLAAVLIGIAAGRIAAWAEHIRAPLLVFPLAVGGAVGLAMMGLARLADIVHRPTLVAAAALAALGTVAGQHYFPYRDYLHNRAAFLAEKAQNSLAGAVLEGLPDTAPSFAAYMRGQADVGRPVAGIALRGAAAWASWALDGLLVLASAVAVVVVFSRRSGREARSREL